MAKERRASRMIRNPLQLLSMPAGLLWLIFCASTILAAEQVFTDGILAKVNSEIITVYDVAKATQGEEQRLREYFASLPQAEQAKAQKQFQEELTKLRIRGANEMINHMVVHAEFARRGFRLPPKVIEQRIDDIVARNGGDWEKFREALQAQNQTLDDFRENVEKRLSVEVLLNQEVDSLVQVTPVDVERYYKENLEAYASEPEIRIQACILKKQERTAAEFEARVKEARAMALSEGDFGRVIAAYSDHFTRDKGGDMGWMRVKDLNSALSAAFDTYSKGALAGPIHLNDDVWFVLIKDVKPRVYRRFDEVHKEIEQHLKSSQRKERYAAYIQRLRDRCFIRTYFD